MSSTVLPITGWSRRLQYRRRFGEPFSCATRLPWPKAIRASLTMGACILLGIVMGHLDWGLVICIGAFTSLYIGNEPYIKRAVKMSLIAVGLALSLALATVLTGAV